MRFSRTSAARRLMVVPLCAVLAATICASTGLAAMLASTTHAFNDGVNPTWKGTLDVNAVGSIPTQKLVGKIDYAVFEPWSFKTFLTENSIAIPGWLANADANFEMIYAYHLYGTGTNSGLTAGTSPGNTAFSVGVDSSDVRGSVFPTAISTGSSNTKMPWGSAGVANATNDSGGSMIWSYASSGSPPAGFGRILVNQMSGLMVYSSPMMPEWDSVTANSGVANFGGQVPSPGDLYFFPEPGSLTLLVLGSVGLLGLRRRVTG